MSAKRFCISIFLVSAFIQPAIGGFIEINTEGGPSLSVEKVFLGSDEKTRSIFLLRKYHYTDSNSEPAIDAEIKFIEHYLVGKSPDKTTKITMHAEYCDLCDPKIINLARELSKEVPNKTKPLPSEVSALLNKLKPVDSKSVSPSGACQVESVSSFTEEDDLGAYNLTPAVYLRLSKNGEKRIKKELSAGNKPPLAETHFDVLKVGARHLHSFPENDCAGGSSAFYWLPELKVLILK